jgi:hypothetical protein
MAVTYKLIETVTVGSGGAANIEFTSIPGTYTDLLIKLSSRTATGGATDVIAEFNADTTAANYSMRQVQGNGASASSSGGSSSSQALTSSGSTDTASTFANSEMYIPNYAGSTAKSSSNDSVTENNATTAYATLRASLYAGTAAITAIKFTHSSGANFAQYSSASLYGIKNS